MEKIKKFSDSYNKWKARFIKKIEKPVNVCKTIFGYGIMISLFVGGLTVLGYVFALIVGGNLAVDICSFIKSYLIPAITYLSTIMVLFGIILMYLSGESALSAKKKKVDKTENEQEIKN